VCTVWRMLPDVCQDIIKKTTRNIFNAQNITSRKKEITSNSQNVAWSISSSMTGPTFQDPIIWIQIKICNKRGDFYPGRQPTKGAKMPLE